MIEITKEDAQNILVMSDKIYESEEEYLKAQAQEAVENGLVELPQRFPTKKELLNLIAPLIPKVKDGNDYNITAQGVVVGDKIVEELPAEEEVTESEI